MNSWYAKAAFITVLVSSAAILVTKYSPPIPISSVVTQKANLFSVTGEGRVTVIPDEAIINVGITISQNTVKTAQTNANLVIKKISGDLKSLGIDSKDIKTTNYSIYPQYDYKNTPARITGYQVSTSLIITVRDFDKINQVIDISTTDGANTIGGIQLTVNEDKQKELLKQARKQAVKEAEAKARDLAAAAGLSLGRIVNVQESGTPVPQPLLLNAREAVPAPGLGGGTDIQPGSADITSTITLSYETR
jgi:uncharacterized protein YggE